MSLIQLLVIIFIYAVGYLLGVVVAELTRVHGALRVLLLSFGFGPLFPFLFAWPVYRKLGISPRLPYCTGCMKYPEYVMFGKSDDDMHCRCKRCGSIVLISNDYDKMMLIDEHGNIAHRLMLVSPIKFLNLWFEASTKDPTLYHYDPAVGLSEVESNRDDE